MNDTTKFDPNINTGVLWTFIRVDEIMELDELKNLNKELEKRILELEEVLRWLDIQGSLGYEKHDKIKQVLGVTHEHD